MQLRKIQFYLFIIVTLVNFVPQFFFPNQFDDDPIVYIQPAGYAFSIWGPIFLGMIIYSWFQMQSDRTESKYLQDATKAGILAGIASATFVPISYTDIQWLAFINILWHLFALMWLYTSLRKQVKVEENKSARFYYLPTQMYLGWISAATAVSAALVLRQTFGIQLELDTELIITAAVIGALIIVGLLLNFNEGKVASLTIVWALIGLHVAYGHFLPVKIATIAGIIILLCAVLYSVLVKKEKLVF